MPKPSQFDPKEDPGFERVVKLTEAERDSLRKRLLEKLLADTRKCRELGYSPTEFLKMLERGPVEACTQVITSRKLPAGFARLYQMGHLELTAEATTVDGPWRLLFPPEVMSAANKRLEQFNRPDLVRP